MIDNSKRYTEDLMFLSNFDALCNSINGEINPYVFEIVLKIGVIFKDPLDDNYWFTLINSNDYGAPFDRLHMIDFLIDQILAQTDNSWKASCLLCILIQDYTSIRPSVVKKILQKMPNAFGSMFFKIKDYTNCCYIIELLSQLNNKDLISTIFGVHNKIIINSFPYGCFANDVNCYNYLSKFFVNENEIFQFKSMEVEDSLKIDSVSPLNFVEILRNNLLILIEYNEFYTPIQIQLSTIRNFQHSDNKIRFHLSQPAKHVLSNVKLPELATINLSFHSKEQCDKLTKALGSIFHQIMMSTPRKISVVTNFIALNSVADDESNEPTNIEETESLFNSPLNLHTTKDTSVSHNKLEKPTRPFSEIMAKSIKDTSRGNGNDGFLTSSFVPIVSSQLINPRQVEINSENDEIVFSSEDRENNNGTLDHSNLKEFVDETKIEKPEPVKEKPIIQNRITRSKSITSELQELNKLAERSKPNTKIKDIWDFNSSDKEELPKTVKSKAMKLLPEKSKLKNHSIKESSAKSKQKKAIITGNSTLKGNNELLPSLLQPNETKDVVVPISSKQTATRKPRGRLPRVPVKSKFFNQPQNRDVSNPELSTAKLSTPSVNFGKIANTKILDGKTTSSNKGKIAGPIDKDSDITVTATTTIENLNIKSSTDIYNDEYEGLTSPVIHAQTRASSRAISKLKPINDEKTKPSIQDDDESYKPTQIEIETKSHVQKRPKRKLRQVEPNYEQSDKERISPMSKKSKPVESLSQIFNDKQSDKGKSSENLGNDDLQSIKLKSVDNVEKKKMDEPIDISKSVEKNLVTTDNLLLSNGNNNLISPSKINLNQIDIPTNIINPIIEPNFTKNSLLTEAYTNTLQRQIFESINKFSINLISKIQLINKEINKKIVNDLTNKYEILFKELNTNFSKDVGEMVELIDDVKGILHLDENEIVKYIQEKKFITSSK
ncbi:hypothetical protein WICMUC_001797 [Wickerhamomyces mucosus]|uniref:Uncharacterized protein n=1 Tax=Wickerhamomyces mucosus TaxID=1378264 RepID=A0A9P8PS19_9ASCO|nr:hypothetical protein WICMUC_001797 [Wickerhamomyces mucosus]